jgi:hypothetical protein
MTRELKTPQILSRLLSNAEKINQIMPKLLNNLFKFDNAFDEFE